MKGVTFLTDETNKKRLLQIDVKEIAKNPDKIEDLLDIVIAEARKDEPKISWANAKKRLKK